MDKGKGIGVSRFGEEDGITKQMAEMAKRLAELEKGGIVDSEKDSFVAPFAKYIQESEPAPEFRLPTLSKYAGVTTARTHVPGFEVTMAILTKEDALLCKTFASTLEQQASEWFR